MDHEAPTDPIPPLPAGICQVWWASPALATAAHVELLARDERERRERMRRPVDRDRFTIAYALARTVLAAHLGTGTAEIHFERTCLHCGGPHGKPRIDGSDVRFSLSHSGDRVALAVTRDVEVGVDVEVLKPDLDVDLLAGNVLSAEEAAELAAVAPELRVTAFLTYWTRKEAVLKATGEGLAVPLKLLTVTGLDAAPRLTEWSDRPSAPARFQLHDLDAGTGHLAGLAAMDHPEPLRIEQMESYSVLEE